MLHNPATPNPQTLSTVRITRLDSRVSGNQPYLSRHLEGYGVAVCT